MQTLLVLILASVVAASVAGCGPRDARYDPTHYRPKGVLVPQDIAFNRSSVSGADVDGVYVLPGDADGLCCLASPHVNVPVKKYGPARELEIYVDIPSRPEFDAHAQRLRIAFPRAGSFSFSQPLKPGFHAVSVPLPPALRELRGVVDVKIDAEVSFSGAGAAAPRYAFVMLSLYFA